MKYILLFAVVFLCGCSSMYTLRTDDELNGLNLGLESDAIKLKTSANIIDSESKQIKVKQEATKIFIVATDLIKKDLTAKKIKEYTQSLEEQIQSLMNAKNLKIDNLFYLGIVTGALIFLAGVAFIIVCYAAGVPNLAGLALQITLFGGSVVLLSGMAYYYFWLGITALGILVAVFIVMILLKIIKDNKSLLEVVRTNEIFKNFNDPESKELANIVQSKGTKKLVNNIRKQDNLK